MSLGCFIKIIQSSFSKYSHYYKRKASEKSGEGMEGNSHLLELNMLCE